MELDPSKAVESSELTPDEVGRRLGVTPVTVRRSLSDGRLVGGVAVEEGTFVGMHDGVLHTPTGEIPHTGRPVRVDNLQVLRIRGGRHVSFNLMFDRLQMLEQLGLVPEPTG